VIDPAAPAGSCRIGGVEAGGQGCGGGGNCGGFSSGHKKGTTVHGREYYCRTWNLASTDSAAPWEWMHAKKPSWQTSIRETRHFGTRLAQVEHDIVSPTNTRFLPQPIK
jgi:hypothetical protein